MLAKSKASTIVVCLAACVLQGALARRVAAQAWVPPKGDGLVTFTYQKVDVRNHYNSVGKKNDAGHIHTHNAVMAFEYGLTDKLALDFDLTFVASKYQGLHPHGPPDTGFYHPAFQDLHAGLRYNLLNRDFVVTPFIAFTLPTHDYEVRGHSAIGRGFKELQMGVNVGRSLGPILRNAYVHIRYSFALLKHFEGLGLNRSNADCEVGWAANRIITFRFIASWQKVHGGFEFPQDIHNHDDFDIHDRVARANYVQLGGGVSYSLNRTLDVHFAYAAVPVYARNTHGDKGMVFGISWKFSRGPAGGRIATNTSTTNPAGSGNGLF